MVIWCTQTKRNFWLLPILNSKIGGLEFKPRFGSIPGEGMESERSPYVWKLWPTKYQWETHEERTRCNSWPTARSKRVWWHQVFLTCTEKLLCTDSTCYASCSHLGYTETGFFSHLVIPETSELKQPSVRCFKTRADFPACVFIQLCQREKNVKCVV